MLEQLLQGQPVIYQPQQAVSITELNQIELALADLSVQLQTDQRKIEALNLQVEQLSQREQIAQSSRDHFQSMITHELKSPLNAILGGVQLLQASHLDTHQSDNLKLITDGSYYLSRLLDQVLALLSLEQGRVALRYEAFEPVQLLSQLIDEYQKTAFTQQLPLELSIQHAAILLRADVSKIQQVLRLLLDNAFKFTDHGHVRISAHTEVQSNQMVAWICEVSDTGIGIEPAIQKDIFKPFFQADSSHNRQHEGAGVGLALAQRLTQMMGGVLRVSSQPQQGSQFQLRVPLRTWQQVHHSDSLSSRQMLVYETGLAGELCQLLEQSGMTVQRVQSIEHAIRICKSMSIDGLMICVHVPNIAVKKLLTQLRQQVQHQHVVVIRVVQQSAPIDRAHGYEWGIDHWLTFPLTQQQLVQQLDQWIGC
ncbi:MAG: sensor histidine kinase, partial [Flavobacteriales bacterium]